MHCGACKWVISLDLSVLFAFCYKNETLQSSLNWHTPKCTVTLSIGTVLRRLPFRIKNEAKIIIKWCAIITNRTFWNESWNNFFASLGCTYNYDWPLIFLPLDRGYFKIWICAGFFIKRRESLTVDYLLLYSEAIWRPKNCSSLKKIDIFFDIDSRRLKLKGHWHQYILLYIVLNLVADGTPS